MANANNTQGVRKTSSSTKSSVQKNVQSSPKKESPAKKMIPKDIDLNQYVTVRNGFQGRLIYKSKKTGEVYVWEEFGDEQEMELIELKNAKNSFKTFFRNNWFMFDEDWVIDYLGVRPFYKNAIPIDHFDEIFTKSAKELTDIIGKLSDGQKKSVAYRAKELITESKIDSLSVVNALEKALDIELIEK